MKFRGILSQKLKFSLSLAKSERIDENHLFMNLIFSVYSELTPIVELLVSIGVVVDLMSELENPLDEELIVL